MTGGPAPSRAFLIATTALVMAALVIDGLDYQLLALLAPVILEEWGVDRGSFGTAMAAALFGMAIGAGGGGWLGDRIGRLRALVLSVVLFGCATVAASRADGVPALAVLRVIGGVGFGAAGPNAIALVTDWLPERWRTYAVALLAVGTPAGGMVGALVLPVLLPPLGWRGVFVALGLLAVALAVVLALLLREAPRAERVAGGEPVALFSRANLRLNAGIGTSFAALTAIVYGLNAWMPSFLTDAGFTLEQALAASFAFNACSIAGALLAGWLVRAAGSRVTLLGSTLLACLCLVGFGLTLDHAPAVPDLALRTTLDALAAGVGGFASVAVTTLYAMAALLYPPAIRAGGIGLGMTLGRIGGIGMSFAGGYLLDWAGGSALLLFGVLALCALVATTAGWLVRQHVTAA
ncbi:MFS transporter [Alteraurantiacibacter buctensis]|uniref:MFS transporter n=1 Tax=Alteraurantiacibacter buctensis TaxID=1503981 RepID=A0A844YTL9_9SPHN|nr:MFS transporter [Alteraurantiacibacter buctensis]MXO70462.1 MFS transporter [Alteraurantiacibacter buctensis]